MPPREINRLQIFNQTIDATIDAVITGREATRFTAVCVPPGQK